MSEHKLLSELVTIYLKPGKHLALSVNKCKGTREYLKGKLVISTGLCGVYRLLICGKRRQTDIGSIVALNEGYGLYLNHTCFLGCANKADVILYLRHIVDKSPLVKVIL